MSISLNVTLIRLKKLKEIPHLKDIFFIGNGIDGLQNSAQQFLDRPDDVFGDNDLIFVENTNQQLYYKHQS